MVKVYYFVKKRFKVSSLGQKVCRETRTIVENMIFFKKKVAKTIFTNYVLTKVTKNY